MFDFVEWLYLVDLFQIALKLQNGFKIILLFNLYVIQI